MNIPTLSIQNPVVAGPNHGEEPFTMTEVQEIRQTVDPNPSDNNFPTMFHPPKQTDTPTTLFAIGTRPTVTGPRFIRKTNPHQIIIWTDGACINNGQANPSAGCAFVYRTAAIKPKVNAYISFRLETQGPAGKVEPQTSNRAELRAVIAALQFRRWDGEGWKSLVIATDSEYVALGATEWVKGWRASGWKKTNGRPVKNRDLWLELLRCISKLSQDGVEVLFWRIPREQNMLADEKAKEGARMEVVQEYSKINGWLF
jgi:ribonuclease HI